MNIMHIMASKARWSTTSVKSRAGERSRTFGAWKVALVCDEFSGYNVSTRRTHVDIGQLSAGVNVRPAEAASDEAGVRRSGGFCAWANAATHLLDKRKGRAR